MWVQKLIFMLVWLNNSMWIEFLSQGDTKEGECGVLQEVGRDHTEPEFTVFLEAEDDRSNVILTLDVGTVPGGTNVLSGTELGGFSTTLNDVCLID